VRRVADIPLLVEYFIDRFGKEGGKRSSKPSIEKPSNYSKRTAGRAMFRELQNVIERAVILSDGDTFSVDETWVKREPPPSR